MLVVKTNMALTLQLSWFVMLYCGLGFATGADYAHLNVDWLEFAAATGAGWIGQAVRHVT